MNAIHAIDRILALGLNDNGSGTIKIDSSALESCELLFGSVRAIIAPQPYTTYLFECKRPDSPNEIGEPDALLIQTSFDGTMLIYMYELTND